MRSTYDIMKDLYTGIEGQSAAWDELSNVEKAAMGEALAGKNQYNVFTSVMENFESAIGATSTALDSQGSAARENAKYMDSLEAKIVAIKSSFQELAINVINSDTVKGILDGVNSFLEFLNTDIGATVTKFTLLTGAITGFVSIAGNIGGKLAGMIDLFTGIGDAVSGFASAAGTASEVAGTVAGAAGTAAKGASTISETAETVITVSSNAIEAASEVADSAGDVAKTAGNVADAAGDVSKVASNTVSAASDVVSATANVAEGIAEAGSAAGKSASKMSKISSFLGNISKYALPAAGAISGVAIAIGAMVKAAQDNDVENVLNEDISTFTAQADDIKRQIEEVNAMEISPSVKEGLLDGLNRQLEITQDQIDDLNRRKIEWAFSGSEYQNLQQSGNKRLDAIGNTADQTKNWEKLTQAYESAYDAFVNFDEFQDPDKFQKVNETLTEQRESVLELADGIKQTVLNGDELTSEMQGFMDWFSQSGIMGEGFNWDEYIWGGTDAASLNEKAEEIKNSLSGMPSIIEDVNSAFEDGEGTYDEYSDSLQSLNEQFSESIDEWPEYYDRLNEALDTGNLEEFNDVLKDIADSQIEASYSAEQMAAMDEEVLASIYNSTGVFDSYAEALEYARYKKAEFSNEPLLDIVHTAEFRTEEQNAASLESYYQNLIITKATLGDTPIETSANVAALQDEQVQAELTRQQDEFLVQAQAILSDSTLDVSQKVAALMELKSAAEQAAAAIIAANSGIGSYVNEIVYTDPKTGRKYSRGGPTIHGQSAQGSEEIPETGRYWVGEQGPEVVTLPEGASVTSNKDIRRATGLKIEKGSIKGGRAQGTSDSNNISVQSAVSNNDDPYSNLYDVKSIKGGYAQGTDDAVADVIEKVVEEIWDGLSENSLRDYLEKNIYEPIMNNPPTEKRYEFRDPGVETYVTKINNLIQKANAGAEEALRIAEEENEALERQLDLYEAQTKVLDHKLFLMEKNGADQYEQIALLRQMQKEANDEANSLRAQGYSDESEYIMQLQREW